MNKNKEKYDPGLMMLRQAHWAFDNWIIYGETSCNQIWEGRFRHMISEYMEYEQNEKTLRGTAGLPSLNDDRYQTPTFNKRITL